jgi:Uma2 family endonuclease
MSEPYEEMILGERTLRLPPGPRHELICGRLHAALQASVANFAGAKLLAIRSSITLSAGNELRPDIALITAANEKLWLAVEVVSSEDHKADTVYKKDAYEAARVPRLWMVDPRYNNIEVYFATPYGLRLQEILATRDVLTEKLLPEFQISVPELFASTTD